MFALILLLPLFPVLPATPLFAIGVIAVLKACEFPEGLDPLSVVSIGVLFRKEKKSKVEVKRRGRERQPLLPWSRQRIEARALQPPLAAAAAVVVAAVAAVAAAAAAAVMPSAVQSVTKGR